jgi:hypothetical protein
MVLQHANGTETTEATPFPLAMAHQCKTFGRQVPFSNQYRPSAYNYIFPYSAY